VEATLLTEIPVVEARAWRIRFADALAKDQESLVVVKVPISLVAVAEAVEFADALAEQSEKTPAENDRRNANSAQNYVEKEDAAKRPLLLLCLPPGAGLTCDIETRLDAWLREGYDAPPVRADLRTSRVVWSSDRAVIYAGQEQMSDAIDALIRFTMAARLTSDLEDKMAALWPTLDAHAQLIHSVTPREQHLQPAVDAMTIRTAHMMSALLRLEAALEQLDPALASPSKRLYAELVQQAAIYERLEVLEDPIEHAVDIYELANTRLADARYARQWHVVEIWIAVLLAAEVIVMTYAVVGPGILSRLWGH
jgi:hypothetical protein